MWGLEQVGKLTVDNGLFKIPLSSSSFQNCILIQDDITFTVFTFDIIYPIKHQLFFIQRLTTKVVFNIILTRPSTTSYLTIIIQPPLLESHSSFDQRTNTIIHNGSCIDPPLHARENAQR